MGPTLQANDKSLIATLLMLKNTNATATSYGDSTVLWPGSSTKFRKLNLITID